jgi:hypothetical protein
MYDEKKRHTFEGNGLTGAALLLVTTVAGCALATGRGTPLFGSGLGVGFAAALAIMLEFVVSAKAVPRNTTASQTTERIASRNYVRQVCSRRWMTLSLGSGIYPRFLKDM